MIGLSDVNVTNLVLQFEVVRKQFCQILAVILVVIVNVTEEVNEPIAGVYFVRFTAAY